MRLTSGVWAAVCVGLLLRLGIASHDLELLDRLFIPDDTYYTLSIARSLAAGLGPSADGVQLTNGFQPLLAFLMVPVFWMSDGLDAPLRMAILLMALCDTVNVALMGALGYRFGGKTAGMLAASMWALSPIAISNALGGLETALALCASLAMVALWARARAEPSAPPTH